MVLIKIFHSKFNSIKNGFIALSLLISILILLVLLSDSLHTQDQKYHEAHSLSAIVKQTNLQDNKVTFDDIRRQNISFNITSNQDFLVLLHIQKTGGTTFERHLVHDLELTNPCSCTDDKRRCWCPKTAKQNDLDRTTADRTWLISRFSTGWVCGLHADWTQLNSCLANLDKLFFMTFLRHPLHRFVSELRHVQRGATWKASKVHCKEHDTQLCYENQSNWLNVKLEEFLDCSSNMAINRQTFMLADMSSIGCTFKSTNQNAALLENAKDNLKRMAFFGICEEQRASQLVFEETFRLKFQTDFRQSDDNKTKLLIDQMPIETRNRIVELNHLDMELYQFATDLFRTRCRELSPRCGDSLIS